MIFYKIFTNLILAYGVFLSFWVERGSALRAKASPHTVEPILSALIGQYFPPNPACSRGRLRDQLCRYSQSQDLTYLSQSSSTAIQCLKKQTGQDAIYVVNGLYWTRYIQYKSTTTLWSSEVNFAIDWSFELRYCMSFYLNWHRNYARLKLNMLSLLTKFESTIIHLA